MLNATTSVITRALKARIGWNRIGLAISDPTGSLARPLPGGAIAFRRV